MELNNNLKLLETQAKADYKDSLVKVNDLRD